MLHNFNEREGEWVRARMRVSVCVKGGGGGGGGGPINFFFFPPWIQYRLESNTDYDF